MKWLLYVYPQKWRARYGEELLYILSMKKPTLRDVMNILFHGILERFLAGKDLLKSSSHTSLYYLQSSFPLLLLLIVVCACIGYSLAMAPTPDFSIEWILLFGVVAISYFCYVSGIIKVLFLFQKHTK